MSNYALLINKSTLKLASALGKRYCSFATFVRTISEKS